MRNNLVSVSWRCVAAFMVLNLLVASIFALSLIAHHKYYGLLPQPKNLIDNAISFNIQNVNEWRKEAMSGSCDFVFSLIPKGTFGYPNDVSRFRLMPYIPTWGYLLYVISEIKGEPATVKMVQSTGLGVHYFSVLFFSWIIFFCLFRVIPLLPAVIFGLASSLLTTFCPGPMFFFFQILYSDTFVLPFLVVVILLEILIDITQDLSKTWLMLLLFVVQEVMLCLGLLVEWIFVPFVFVLLLKRLALGQLGATWRARFENGLIYIFPLFLGFMFFLIYCLSRRGIFELLYAFFMHTGTREDSWPLRLYLPVYWGKHVSNVLGPHAALFILVNIVIGLGGFVGFFFLRKRGKLEEWRRECFLISAIGLLTLPCLFHSLILTDHCIENAHTALRLVFTFSAVFTLTPVLIVLLLGRVLRVWMRHEVVDPNVLTGRRWGWTVLGMVSFLVSVVWLQLLPGTIDSRMGPYTKYFEEWGTAVKEANIEGDMLFCPQYLDWDITFQTACFSECVIWPLLRANEFMPFVLNKICPLDFNKKSPLDGFMFSKEVLDFGIRWGLLPPIRDSIPDSFTMGIVVDTRQPVVSKEFERVLPYAVRDVTRGYVRNVVIPMDALRKLYSAVPGERAS